MAALISRALSGAVVPMPTLPEEVRKRLDEELPGLNWMSPVVFPPRVRVVFLML